MMSLLLALLLAAEPAADRLIICGGEEVFILPANTKEPTEKDRLWRWRAADSPEIPAEMRTQFRSTDECKPTGDAILITSSSGGVALIRRSDKKCLFHTSAKNAHSACLLPGKRLAVASSHGGDELLIFDMKKPGADVAPLARLPLDGAHGALWDAGRERLWSLGTKDLLLLQLKPKEAAIELAVDKRIELPTTNGHDLTFGRDPRFLFITTNTRVYRYDTRENRFEPFPEIADQPGVKSVDQHPTTGRIVYHQGTAKTWWSDTIRFLQPAGTLQLANERIYKVRWDTGK